VRALPIRTFAILVAPAMALLVVLFCIPVFRSLWLSLFAHNLDTALVPRFVGLANYQRALGDGRFHCAIGHTFFFTLFSLALEIVLGVAMALVMQWRWPWRGALRAVVLIPWVLPTALIALGWTWIFHDRYGLVNDLLLRVGAVGEDVNWLGQPATAYLALIVADAWKTAPFVAILTLAGLQTIPADLYDAHSLDGASSARSFWVITLPLLMPYLAVAALFRFAQAFGVFELVLVMTGGGPGGSTEMVSSYLYSMVMRYLDIGYGAALVVVVYVILAIAVLAVWGMWRMLQRRLAL
jgi:multiple sugar transport system permease protein